MEDTLDNLLLIQSLDDEIKHAHIHIDDIPHRIAHLEKSVDKLSEDFQKHKQRIQEIKKLYKMKEVDLAENENKIEKLNSQTFAVKTNEEYRAILSEIDFLKKANRKIEDEMIEFLEEEETLKKATSNLEKETKDLIDKKKNEIETLRKTREDLLAKKEQAEKSFQEHFQSLPQDIQNIYTRIHTVRDKAVCRIENNTCTGCYANLPHQVMNELKKRNKLILCDNCGRILIYKKD
jgi:hypothetical protein